MQQCGSIWEKREHDTFEDDDSDIDEPKNAIEMQDKPEIKPKRLKHSRTVQRKTAKKEKYREKMDKKWCAL
eukprot:5736091-Ditylum_brightwellii.AAC.1